MTAQSSATPTSPALPNWIKPELSPTESTPDLGSPKFEVEQIENEIEVDQSQPAEETPPKPPKKSPKNKTWLWILLVILLILISFGAVAGWVGYQAYQVGLEIKSQAYLAKETAFAAYTGFKNQNLPEADAQIQVLQQQVDNINTTYQKLSYAQKLPVVKNYYADGEHALKALSHGVAAAAKSIAAVTPYADVLGFKGQGTFTGGTAEDRLKIVLDTLDKVMPVFDEIQAEITSAEQELLKIDAQRYPDSVRGIEIKPRIIQAQEIAKTVTASLQEYRPVLSELPSIAGGRGQRKKYLILFQNDNELRPTGGFLTAYAVIYVENGKVYPEKSDDIYELDKKFTKKLPIPESLGKYLTTEKKWNLRDMNISPDFKSSMDTFFANYKNVKGEPDNIDGIISVDTHVLTQLLTVLGPVEVPGYGTFSAEIDPRCDCAQVVYALSEIITKPTPYLREDRKGILGPMMAGVLKKAYGAPKQLWPALGEIAWKSMQAKHVQAYLLDEKSQAALETINAAGRMTPKSNSDFLAIVDANLGGAKSNLFVTYEVRQTISSPENGKLKKKVEITYKNSRKADNCNLEAGKLCLNSTLRDWFRLYLPAGSELISATGFTTEAKLYDEAGFSVVDGFFILEPLGTAKIIVEYSLPYEDQTDYRLLIWKQGGLDPIKHIIDVNGGEELLEVDKDTSYSTTF